jgi:hypothetical protein
LKHKYFLICHGWAYVTPFIGVIYLTVDAGFRGAKSSVEEDVRYQLKANFFSTYYLDALGNVLYSEYFFDDYFKLSSKKKIKRKSCPWCLSIIMTTRK